MTDVEAETIDAYLPPWISSLILNFEYNLIVSVQSESYVEGPSYCDMYTSPLPEEVEILWELAEITTFEFNMRVHDPCAPEIRKALVFNSL